MHRYGGVAKLVMTMLAAVAAAGCGGGGGDDPPSTGSASVGSNTAPTIQGQPGSSVLVGQAYTFQPTASDPNGDALTFSASNLPAWLTLNPNTGRVSGTPTAADIATVSGITITVSDGRASATLGPFSISINQTGSGTALLSWTPPVQNTDGTPLVDLRGYQILYGRSSTELNQSISVDNPSLSSYLVENLTSGTWYFSVAAVNASGAASNPSGVASKTIT
jgi:hypothetical protein